MNIVQLAGMLPRDPLFRAWVASLDGGEALDEEQCAELIRVVCGVDSRRELAHNAAAVDRFHDLIRKPFVAWKAQQTETARG